MDSTLKQRLIGAAVLAALAIIFLPMLLKGPDVREPDAAAVPLSMPAAPGQEYETRELPLTEPEGSTPPGGVLGMGPAPGAAAVPSLPVPDQPSAAAQAVAPVTLPAPAPSPAAAAAIAAGNYVVNIGSFSNLENAGALVGKLRAAKLPVAADRVTLASGTAMRIRVGPYADRAAAEAARLRAEAVTGSGSKVVVLDAGPGPAPRPATQTPPPSAPTAAPTAPVASKPAVPAVKDAGKPVAIATGFAVQLSAPSVEAEAIALRDRARSLGFDSFVRRVETDSGARFRVRVGPVADRATAGTLRDAVNDKLGTKGIVVVNP